MLYSKRRKNLGGGRKKRSNRKSNRSNKFRMKGGMLPAVKAGWQWWTTAHDNGHISNIMDKKMQNVDPSVTAKDVGFTGHSMNYEPCPIEEKPLNLDTHEKFMNWYTPQQNIQDECRLTEIKWDNLSKEAKQVEIEKQWSKLTEGQKMLFINADSDAEREYLLYGRLYLSMDADKQKQWKNYTPEQKQLFISTVTNKDLPRTRLQDREINFLSNKDRAAEFLQNPLKWSIMNEEEKNTYMDQHQYVGHQFDFKKGEYNTEWLKTLTEKQRKTLKMFVDKKEIGSIQFFSTPLGQTQLDNLESNIVYNSMSGH
jgi:hypothetical protein